MTLNQINRAVKMEENLFVGLRMHKTLFKNLEHLGFWQSGSTRDGNEEHYFFIARCDDRLTLDVTLMDRVVMGISVMYM